MGGYDFLIIGSGMAGASAAFALADEAKVLLVEREAQHGYHTTGRSAALYSEAYGGEIIRGLTIASRAFFDRPPEGFAQYPLLTPRGCLYVGAAGQEADLAALAHRVGGMGIDVRGLDAAEVRRRVPILRAEAVQAGVFEPGAADIDVNALHHGFLRGAKARGAGIRLDAWITTLSRDRGVWTAEFADGTEITAQVIVDAAGAWADELAVAAGARAMGLSPLRRTAVLLDAPSGHDVGGWPALIDVAERFYFKPEAGRLLASPADETPSAPCDAFADELDIAICIDRIQAVAELPVRRILKSWAGLRTFASDRAPVIGFDPTLEGFFWLAGQGGYGVQTAPAAGRLAAALALGRAVPSDIAARGVTAERLSPARFVQA